MRFLSYIRTAIVVAIAASLSLSLTGCGDEDDQQVSGTAGSGSSLTGPDNGNGNDNQSEPVDTETDTDSSATSPTSCLVGTWLADNQQLGALFESCFGGNGRCWSRLRPERRSADHLRRGRAVQRGL